MRADKMTRATTVGALARAFGLTLDEFEGLLSGMADGETLRKRAKRRAAAGEGVAK